MSPSEVRRSIIERFISRWRQEVGNDIHPAFRLIIPEKDRDRAMYGLKEKTIGKLLVRIIKIDKNSEDGYNLLNWKLPGQKVTSSMAGDFAGRCYEVLSKRAMRSTVGTMTIGEVNDLLDRLSYAQKEEHQFPIFEDFYKRMNAEEMMWLIRIVLRQMKIGATERTIFDVWHPDAETLFNVSSNLRRVCWELWDSSVRLEGDDTDITLMQCFQPQLAQFQMKSFDWMVGKMRQTETDRVFWIEEKLDGERMQLHMVEDSAHPGGKRFGFWSRKAKDYTYLYGSGFEDNNSALTRHLKTAFHPGVRNIILDGEMITWDPELDIVVPFGTLKTAAISEQKNPFSTGQRPLYRVFDVLYLNDEALTKYTLRDRRKALETAVNPIHRRLEVHSYTEAETSAEIEPLLRTVVAESSEGLVIKNPRSMYRLNERNDDWIKVKPEYMTEFGEALDCVVIGGYYGSGKRGGGLSSFMCGLRVDQDQINQGAHPEKCYSFFKVGGGFTAADYQKIRHMTDGKWIEWNSKQPPTDFIELGGGDKQYEKPDVWIRPKDSVVFAVKAASVAGTPQFRVNMTLRFPRFKALREDRDWKTALSIRGFIELKNNVEDERKDKQFTIDDARRKRARITRPKKDLVVVGTAGAQLHDPLAASAVANGASPSVTTTANLFAGAAFYVLSESLHPLSRKMSKPALEDWLKARGAKIYQSATAHPDVVCVADRNLVKVASLQKTGRKSIVRPAWLFDCETQALRDFAKGRSMQGAGGAFLLPWEPRHMLFVAGQDEEMVGSAADEFGDGYARDVFGGEEMRALLEGMPSKFEAGQFDAVAFLTQLGERGQAVFEDGQGDGKQELMFTGSVVHFDTGAPLNDESMHVDNERGYAADTNAAVELDLAANVVRFAGGRISHELKNTTQITHVVVDTSTDRARVRAIRSVLKR